VRVLAVVLWGVAALGAAWAALPRDTRRGRLHAGALRRLVRAVRSTAVRLVLWLLGWPHLIDAFFGARRARVGTTPADVVWQRHSTVLVRYRRSTPPRFAEPVLVVHSTVSQPWILDLTPTRSFVVALLDAGFDVFLLDWGSPGGEQLDLAGHAARLRAAEAAVLEAAGTSALHRVGYCFGASLALWDAATWPTPHVASSVLIAADVDFDVPGGFHTMLRSWAIPPVMLLDGEGYVPAAVIREGFHGLRPQALRTVWFRLRKRGDREYRQFYAAMARWAWTHRRMPGALLFDVIDLHRTNGLLPLLSRLDRAMPMLVVAAQRDHIVPVASATAVARVPGLRVDVLEVPTGHVSMIVGTTARAAMWPGVIQWLAARQAGSPPTGPDR
jgi:polyhydroxyalkanoate synthase